MPIVFSNNEINFNLKNKLKIKKWILTVIKKEKHTLENLSYVFTTDEALLKINKEFLNHNTYTDIITFDYSESKIISGEIFISVDRVKENAAKLNLKFEEELHRVIIHGVLHLCGYKDKTKADSLLMRSLEDKNIKLLNRI